VSEYSLTKVKHLICNDQISFLKYVKVFHEVLEKMVFRVCRSIGFVRRT